jgi:hypothetical protein
MVADKQKNDWRMNLMIYVLFVDLSNKLSSSTSGVG